jgi:uncharacterized delta-60 repeat protein
MQTVGRRHTDGTHRPSRGRGASGAVAAALLAALALTVLAASAFGAAPASELPSGALDPSFASGGVLMQQLGSLPYNEYGSDAVLQPDGKIIVLTTTDSDYLSRYLPDGTLDTTFGNGGSVELPHGGDSLGYTAIALDSQGRIVVVGAEADRTWESPPGSPQGELGFGRNDAVVYRYLPGGELDTSFGSGGKTVLSVPPPEGLTPGSASTGPQAVSVGPDDSITVGGGVASICEWESVPGVFGQLWQEHGTFVARLSGNGDPESRFGTAGIVSTHGECENKSGAVSEYFGAMTEPSPGAPLALSVAAGTWRFRFYSPAGELTEHAVTPPAVYGNTAQLPLQIAVLPDHDLLVAARPAGWQTLQRFTPQAELDPSFGEDGVVVAAIECLSCNAGTFTVLSDERILLAGVMEGIYGAITVRRYLPNGSIDESFGGNNSGLGNPGQAWAQPLSEPNELYVSKVLDLNGQALVVGTSKNATYPHLYLTTLVLFEADGGFASNPQPKPGEGPSSPIPNEPSPGESPTGGNSDSTNTGSTSTGPTGTPGAGTPHGPDVRGIQTTTLSARSIRAALDALLRHRLPPLRRLLKTGVHGLYFNAPGPGTLTVRLTSTTVHASHQAKRKARPVVIAEGTHTFETAGRGTIRLRLTTAGRRLLKKDKKLRVIETARFAPSGGGTQTTQATITIRTGHRKHR